jgi:hypothetical protein
VCPKSTLVKLGMNNEGERMMSASCTGGVGDEIAITCIDSMA